MRLVALKRLLSPFLDPSQKCDENDTDFMLNNVQTLVRLREFLKLNIKNSHLTANDVVCLSSSLLGASIQDCYCRFILNVPQNYLTNIIHICFAIQEAYWWYKDFWYNSFTSILPKMSMRQFGILLFERCPLLRLYFTSEQYDTFIELWKDHCKRIPLKGAILVNNTLTKVLMVKGWGRNYWMFPRGKVDEFEDDVACAVREVKEELGVDISNFIDSRMYIEIYIEDQPIKLFIIPGVLESTHFEPRKRKEIGQIGWISLERMPGWKPLKKKHVRMNPLINKKVDDHLRFWNVHPFTTSLHGWIHLIQLGLDLKRGRKATRRESMGKCVVIHSSEQCVEIDYISNNSLNTSDKMSEGICGDLKYKNSVNATVQHSVYLPSLIQRQPAEAKPDPVPPLIDETCHYAFPERIPPDVLRRLQHPFLQDSQPSSPPVLSNVDFKKNTVSLNVSTQTKQSLEIALPPWKRANASVLKSHGHSSRTEPASDSVASMDSNHSPLKVPVFRSVCESSSALDCCSKRQIERFNGLPNSLSIHGSSDQLSGDSSSDSSVRSSQNESRATHHVSSYTQHCALHPHVPSICYSEPHSHRHSMQNCLENHHCCNVVPSNNTKGPPPVRCHRRGECNIKAFHRSNSMRGSPQYSGVKGCIKSCTHGTHNPYAVSKEQGIVVQDTSEELYRFLKTYIRSFLGQHGEDTDIDVSCHERHPCYTSCRHELSYGMCRAPYPYNSPPISGWDLLRTNHRFKKTCDLCTSRLVLYAQLDYVYHYLDT